MLNILSFLCGLLFGFGLLLSGMINPAKVQGFLDLAGQWDPSLALVMVGAIASATGIFTLAHRRSHALISCVTMSFPSRRRIDQRLFIGSGIFGIGWGLAGICPGPGLVALATGDRGFILFVLAMLAGIALFEILETRGNRPENSITEE